MDCSSRDFLGSPEQELQQRGFRIEEKCLSVGGARILARVDLLTQVVFIDEEALREYAQERGTSVEAVRNMALAHELGHVFHPELRGRAAERAAQEYASRWEL